MIHCVHITNGTSPEQSFSSIHPSSHPAIHSTRRLTRLNSSVLYGQEIGKVKLQVSAWRHHCVMHSHLRKFHSQHTHTAICMPLRGSKRRALSSSIRMIRDLFSYRIVIGIRQKHRRRDERGITRQQRAMSFLGVRTMNIHFGILKLWVAIASSWVFDINMNNPVTIVYS